VAGARCPVGVAGARCPVGVAGVRCRGRDRWCMGSLGQVRDSMATPNMTRWTVLEIASRIGGHMAPKADGALPSCRSRGRLGVLWTLNLPRVFLSWSARHFWGSFPCRSRSYQFPRATGWQGLPNWVGCGSRKVRQSRDCRTRIRTRTLNPTCWTVVEDRRCQSRHGPPRQGPVREWGRSTLCGVVPDPRSHYSYWLISLRENGGARANYGPREST
jgi:hypothetical protein